jgi:hypothetical protein
LVLSPRASRIDGEKRKFADLGASYFVEEDSDDSLELTNTRQHSARCKDKYGQVTVRVWMNAKKACFLSRNVKTIRGIVRSVFSKVCMLSEE